MSSKTQSSSAPSTLEEWLKQSNFTKEEFDSVLTFFRTVLGNPAFSPFSISSNAGTSSAPGGGAALQASTIATPGGVDAPLKIERSRFRDLLRDELGLEDPLLVDRVFRCLDTDGDNFVNFEEFVNGLSVLLKGSLPDQAKFCFKVYDLNGDRFITKDDMFQVLKNCFVKSTEDDGVKDMVDLVLKKMDEDRDGKISESDYVSTVKKETLLLEAFGHVLPDPKV